VYGLVRKAFGDRRFKIEVVSDGTTMDCRLAGSMPMSNYVKVDDCVLVAMRLNESSSSKFYQPGADIIWKYSPAEIRTLQKMGELTERCSAQLETSAVCFVSTETDEFDFEEEKWGGRELPPNSEDDDSEDDA
jgi:translation initiation factor IF-1